MQKKIKASVKSMRKSTALSVLLAATGLSAIPAAHAAEWSDDSIGYRYGTNFAEPFVGNDITKSIVSFTHASGYKYGTNYLNVDVLMSNSVDHDATEAYLLYRNTLDFGKIFNKDFKYGLVRDLGFTFGFDLNTKNDPGYASKKRMLVAGPTLMLDVPGFLNVSLLALQESNEPVGITSRYTYRTHPMLNLAWGIPVGSSWAFEGYLDYIAAKGTDEFGNPTAPEFNFDGQIMYDLGTALGVGKNTFRIGFEYQYWRNKFGNPSTVPGSLGKTPMVRAEYHF